MSAPELDVERFYTRLGRLHTHFTKNRSAWGGASCFCMNRGPTSDESSIYLKSVILQQYLFGYELPDTVVLLTAEGKCFILSAKKKIEFLQAASKKPSGLESPITSVTLLTRNKADGNAENYETLFQAIQKSSTNQNKENATKVGLLIKERDLNKDGNTVIVGAWEKYLEDQSKGEGDDDDDAAAKIDIVDVAHGVSFAMSPKDDVELDLIKKSSVLSNKILKHGCIPRLEEIIDSEQTVTHEQLATEIDGIIGDPSKINLKVPSEDVDSCYYPIIQSGGDYDIKISAQSNGNELKYDIVTVSLGSRYRMYCSNIARTFLVDPPKKISEMYELLLSVQEACLEAMIVGKPLKSVYKAAVMYLKGHGHDSLVKSLPKNLGFAIGLDFRDGALLLNHKNSTPFRKGMVFNLMIGFQGIPLTDDMKTNTNSKSAVKNLSNYSLLVSDMVVIKSDAQHPEVLTKLAKSLSDISYTINDDDSDDAESEEEEAEDGSDAALARKLQKQEKQGDGSANGQRQSARLAVHQTAAQEVQEGAAERERRQIDLMSRRNEDRLRELAKLSRSKNGESEADRVEELEAYKRTKDFPDYVQPNQVKVDMANQCVILPISGNPIPFHISTIKNVVLPDPDEAATYLRINFYTAGMALGKDAPGNMVKLVQKYAPYASFIREMTFRSLDSQNLTQAFRQISELRKRARTRELREIEEANLVEQEKLVRTKNERVPRLSDLTMRPVIHGRKTQGNLEAHSNGLRFISTRQEVVDIMYNNIKYAIFQPCENEIMVLVHFHLKNPIMVGKKRQRDIQFFTEVVDASQTVDAGRSSMYDPDEVDDEQRERHLRKRLNQAFKDFCKKVDNVAKKNNYSVEFDIPYRDLGFQGNPHKEMVFIQPTLNCLVNLTETPFFLTDLADVDHVHFERVTYLSKAFDAVLINKDFSKQPWRIDMIPNGDKEAIQEWLTDMEITYTEGPMNLNWKQIMNTVKDDDRFYMNTEEDEVTEKEAGWEFLRLFGREDEEEEEDDGDDSEFSEAGPEDEESLEEEESEFDSESEEESDFDADEELEEQGMDWEDMERQAAIDDRRRGTGDDPEPDRRGNKRRGSAPKQTRNQARKRRR